MRETRALTLVSLSLLLLIVAASCGLDSAQERVSSAVSDSASEELAERATETVDRLNGVGTSDLEVLTSDEVTLQQLQDAGIPVGSYQIDCDQPLHMVVMEGVFDRETLFETGATLAGGHVEGMAMRLVARIYDPETENPLGMIGAQDGGQLNDITGAGSMSGGSADGSLVFEPEGNDEAGALVPEAVCR